MRNTTTLEAAKSLQTKLGEAGIAATILPQKNNYWLAKLSTPHGTLCVYTNAKGKVTVHTHEIKSEANRTLLEATLAATEQKGEIKPTGKLTAFTDGSAEGGQCGWSTVFFSPEGKKDGELSGNLGPSPNQQIGGEIEGPIQAIAEALNRGAKALLIIHDYEGVGYWGRNEWKHTDPDAGRLKAWAQHAKKKGLAITFQWGKGHAGTYGNERADVIAGLATKLPPAPRLKAPAEIKQECEIHTRGSVELQIG